MMTINNVVDAEAFMLKHGENIVDRVGAEIDRIERNLRVMEILIVLFYSLNFYF
jgi:predicted thioredoxin/glutaredoxin